MSSVSNVFFDEQYLGRMEKFERRIFGKDNNKKHYRCRTKFDPNEYLQFTHNDLYVKINEELAVINAKKIQMIAELYKAFPTGNRHIWVEEDGVFVVKVRPEYLIKD